jgi:hypothetical protein
MMVPKYFNGEGMPDHPLDLEPKREEIFYR